MVEPCIPVYIFKCSGSLFIRREKFKQGSFELKRIKRLFAPCLEIVRNELIPSRFADQLFKVVEKMEPLPMLVMHKKEHSMHFTNLLIRNGAKCIVRILAFKINH